MYLTSLRSNASLGSLIDGKQGSLPALGPVQDGDYEDSGPMLKIYDDYYNYDDPDLPKPATGELPRRSSVPVLELDSEDPERVPLNPKMGGLPNQESFERCCLRMTLTSYGSLATSIQRHVIGYYNYYGYTKDNMPYYINHNQDILFYNSVTQVPITYSTSSFAIKISGLTLTI